MIWTVQTVVSDIEAPDKETAIRLFLAAIQDSSFPRHFRVKPEPGLFEPVTLPASDPVEG